MKTKKILAIITLVAFMISILPMAAFAVSAPSQYGSKVYTVESKATADGEDSLEFDVYVGDENGAPLDNAKVYVVTNRSTTDSVYYEDAAKLAVVNTDVYTGTTTDGWVTLQIRSKLAGSVKYAVGVEATGSTVRNLKDYLAGKDVTVAEAGVVANEAGNYITNATFDASEDYTIRFKDATAIDADTDALDDITTYANGTSYAEVEAVIISNNTPVAGVDVDFSLNKSGATLNKDTVTTDSRGNASIKVFATKPDTYTITAEVGDVEKEIQVTFVPTSVDTIKAESDTNKKVALDKSNVTLKYSFSDSNGNKIKQLPADGTITNVSDILAGGEFTSNDVDYDLASDADAAKDGSKAAIIAGAELKTINKPSGADIGDDIDDGDIASIKQDNGNLEIELKKEGFDEEGTYEIRLSLVNGKAVTYTISVKEQGDITGMSISYDASSIPSDTGVTGTPDVKIFDAEGYESDPGHGNVKYTVDNAALASIALTGIVTALDEGTGVINVTAIETENNLVASTTINLVKPASSLKVTAPSYNTVGEEAAVSVQLIDADGKAVSLGTVTNLTVDSSAIILSKPAGAIVTADDTTPASEVQEDGKYSFDIISNAAGNVKVQVVLTCSYTDSKNNSVSKTFSGSTTVNFGEAATGKKDLTMFIGATNYMVGGAPAVTDAAPFIENGRTYVAVRPIGDALGCTIYWDEATQTVTMTKPGETVTIVIGADTIKIDSAGSITEYPTDAPAQIKDGRTYLPFRAIGEAMGYVVNFDAATQAVTFTQG